MLVILIIHCLNFLQHRIFRKLQSRDCDAAMGLCADFCGKLFQMKSREKIVKECKYTLCIY